MLFVLTVSGLGLRPYMTNRKIVGRAAGFRDLGSGP